MENQFELEDDDKMRELILDYIDDNLTGELKDYIGQLIDKNPKARKEYEELKTMTGIMGNAGELEPDLKMREEFLEIINREKETLSQEVKTESEPKVIPIQSFWTMSNLAKIAAAIGILAAGYFLGVQNRNNPDRELAQIRKEMQQMKDLMISSLQEESASQRMKGVNASYTMPQADDEVLKVLIDVLNKDPNANVRLEAAKALNQFNENQIVKDALIQAMENEKEPVVQITLINIMVEIGDKRAVEPLQKLVDDATTIETVKDEAHMGLFKLL